MNGKRTNFSYARRCLGVAALAGAVMWLAPSRSALANEPSQSTARPALEQLNDETTALYQQVQAGMVHVDIRRTVFNRVAPQIPPRPIEPQPKIQVPTTQSSGFSPTGDAGHGAGEPGQQFTISNLTATPGAHITITAHSSNGGTVTVDQSKVEPVPQPNQPSAATTGGNPVLGSRMRPTTWVQSNIAILLDEQGHVLVPTFIDRPAEGDAPLRVAGPDGSMQTAKFVGSDRQTNLSVLKLDKPIGTPLRWTGDRPAKGSLVMYIAPGDGSGRLGIWSGGTGEFGVVVSIDGHVDGIARFGQFLNGSACRLIAQQLMKFGSVKRATLGIIINEILPGDPILAKVPGFGSRSAMEVETVIAGSAADKAGIKPGDLVLELAGQPVNDIPSFAAAIAAREGHTDVQILRGDKMLTIVADLEPK